MVSGNTLAKDEEPSYPKHRGTLQDYLYALADASLSIIEYKYELNREREERDFRKLITSDQRSTWDELIAGHFREIVEQRTLTPAKRRETLARKLYVVENLTPGTVHAITNALLLIWKDRTREQLRMNKDSKRLISRSKIEEGDPMQPYERWRTLWIATVHRQELLRAASQKAIALEAEKKHQEEIELRREALAVEQRERLKVAEEALKAKAAKEAKEQELVALLAEAKVEYAKQLEIDYIAAAEADPAAGKCAMLDRTVRNEIELGFVQAWMADHNNIRVKISPNEDQARAISRMDKRLLVRARAGSGKTTTIVLRTVFLVKHCRVDPRNILLFAFNKSAAEKLEADLLLALGLEAASDDEKLLGLPVVQTFDAFAQAVSMRKPLEKFELDALYQAAIEQLLESDYKRVQAAMLGFFRGEWDRIEADILPGKAATLSQRRTYQPDGARLTLNGEQVKSRGEHRIANWLFEHGIPYKYERHIRLPKVSWAPDFTLYPEDPRPIIVEYLGLQGDPEYDNKTAWKKARLKEIPDERRPSAVWLDPDSTLESNDSEQSFSTILSTLLTAEGHTIRKLSDDEIWDLIKDKALSQFREVLIMVTGRAYQLGWNHEELRNAAVNSEVPELISLCADVMAHISAHNTSGKSSYAEICWSAITELKSAKEMNRELRTQKGQWRQSDFAEINEVIVDEFQDYALRFAGLVQGLLGIATGSRLVAVGDDWQAINRFAGSDAEYIEQWPYPESEVVLPINNRSLVEIVALGNTLMHGRGPLASARASSKSATLIRMNLEDLDTTELEREAVHDLTNIRSDVAIGISRLAIPHIKRGESVAVLSRAKHEIDIVKGERKAKAPLKKMLLEMSGSNTSYVDVDTVHGYKGKEADVVILLADNYPLVHPHRVISEIFGDTEAKVLEDERKLLYVGVTRAKTTLYLLTGVKRRRNPLEAELRLSSGHWGNYPPVGEHINVSEKLLIALSGWGTNEIKSPLLSAKFKWRPKPLNRWERIESEEKDPAAVLSQVMSATWFPKEPLESELVVEILNANGEVLARKIVHAAGDLRQLGRNLDGQPLGTHSPKGRPSNKDDLPF
jgi:DNA helicase-4